MKRLKLLVAAALLGLPLVACEEGTTPPPVGEIDGTVAIEGEGIDGVTVNLSSGAATTTSGGGHFSFTDVEGGTYTITISGFPADASFSATSAEVTIASAGQKVTRNFSGSYIRTSSLEGRVTVEDEGLAGVTVSITGRQEAQTATDANGQYTFTGLRAGNYTVEISGFATDVAFSSTSSQVAVAVGQTGVWSFEGTYVRESTIAGQVSVEGNGLANVTVSLQGMGADETEQTDAGGQFTFSDLRAGDYQLAISGFDPKEYSFSTTTATVRVEHGKTANVPFDGILLRTATIMGQVRVEGEGLPNVTVSLSGEGENLTTTTDNSGQYQFSKLPAGNFQVGISGYDPTDYDFETTSKSVSLALGETETVPFDGELVRTSGLAGRVSVDGVGGLNGVTVTLSGTQDATTETANDGQYAFAGLAEGDYTVAISGYDAVEYAFANDSQDITLEKDKTAIVNFMGKKLRTGAVAVMVTADGMGVAGVAATLFHVTNPVTQAGSIIAAGQTGEDGGLTFGDLLAGLYLVEISGTDEEIDFLLGNLLPVQVATDQTAEATFAGAINRDASIAGTVMVDGDGMSGVEVTLSGGDDDVSKSTETDDDGAYSFTGLRRGKYTVEIDNPDPAMYAFDDMSTSFDLGVAQAQDDISFAGSRIRTSGISGVVDVEGMGLEGVVVTLGGDAEATDTTGAKGAYGFPNLASGSYTVTIANPDDEAYEFDPMSVTVELGNDDRKDDVNFSGMHTRNGSIAGMMYVDEAGRNNSRDEDEKALAVEGVEVTLEGPDLGDVQTDTTDAEGKFAFEDLRAGTYQLNTGTGAVAEDYAYGGPGDGYEIELGVAGEETQDLPFDITHQRLNFTVNLKRGEEPLGHALPGAMITLYADADRKREVAADSTGEDGTVQIRFARAGMDMVYAAIAPPAGDYHTPGKNQTVKWDAQDPSFDVSNAEDIVNLKADFSFSGATVTTDAGGGAALGGWAITVSSDKSAAADAPKKLSDTGTGKYSEVVAADSLPVKYTIALAADQANTLDNGEEYKADEVEYEHTGLKLPATMPAGSLVAEYTTQTLKVYVHEERDQVYGYTGGIHLGDRRDHSMVDVAIRYIERSSGRSRAYTTADSVPAPKMSKGVYTFANVPANDQIIVIASPKTDADIKILRPDELAAYGDAATNHIEMGMFGDEGGYHHTVELCPLRRTDPTGQDHGQCGSFAYVMTHLVEGTVTKQTIAIDKSGARFKAATTVGVEGTMVSLDPVDGRNLAEESRNFKAAKDNPRTAVKEDRQINWDQVPAGVYTLGYDTLKWEANAVQDDDKLQDQPMEFLLGADLTLIFTPTTSVVYGVVMDSDGFAIDSATVTVNGNSTMTDSEGRYIVADYSHKIGTKGDWKNDPITAVSASKGDFEAAHDTVPFVPNTPTPVNLVLDVPTEIITISGTVTMSGTNAPVRDAVIKVDVRDGDGHKAPKNAKGSGANKALKTAADGSYAAQIAKPAATVTTVNVKASMQGITITPLEGHNVPTSTSSPSGFHFSAFENATITGRVKDDAGKAMSGVLVKATAESGALSDSMTTKAGGTYSLSVPPAFAETSHTVTATKDGYTFNTLAVVTGLASGASKAMDDFEATENPAKADDATLSALSLSGGIDLTPAFASATTAYTGTAEAVLESTTVSYTAAAGDKATVAVTPADADDQAAGHQVDLEVGENTITVDVTAEDGTTKKAYTIVVTRKALNPGPPHSMTIKSPESASLTVTWQFPRDEGATTLGGIDKFQVRTNVSAWTDVANGRAANSADIEDLTGVTLVNGIARTVWVRAVAVTGSGANEVETYGEAASIVGTPWPDVSLATLSAITEKDDATTTDTKENEADATLTFAASEAPFKVEIALLEVLGDDTVATKRATVNGKAAATVTVEAGATTKTVKVAAVDNPRDSANASINVVATIVEPEAADRDALTQGLTINDDDTSPTFTTIAVAAATTAGALDVTWTVPDDTGWGTGTESTRRFEYRHRTTTGTFGTWSNLASDAATVTISGLTTGTEYIVEVRACTDAGCATATGSGTPG